ncbi:MAG: motility associated factor glycosyltransferase family protein [Methylocystaceae bacterium]
MTKYPHNKPRITGGINPIYEKNMKTLQTRDPELADRIHNTLIGNRYQVTVNEKDKLPNLYNLLSRQYYYSTQGIIQDVSDQLEQLQLKNVRQAIFLGMGLGYELIYFLRNLSEDQGTQYVLVVEKDMEIFKQALMSVDLSEALANERVTLWVGIPQDQLFVKMQHYLIDSSKFVNLRAAQPIYHLSSLKLYKDYYMSVIKELRSAGNFCILNYGNSPEDSLIGIKNVMHNINEIIYNPGINMLYNSFKDKPAVVISTGPSLNKNKHLLNGIKDKALLIAADASLKVLLAMGVKPHLVTSMERDWEVVNHVTDLDAEAVRDVYFAACPVVDPQVYRLYPGPRIIVYRNFDHFRWIGIDRGIQDIKLSAGNMAFKVAEALGCNPIILIGQDLAFSRDGRTHAAGNAMGENQEFFYQDKILEVMGNDGEPIKTTGTWYSFLQGYEIDVAGYQGICINSTEGGAYIKGTQVMSFQEAIDKFIKEKVPSLQIIADSMTRFSAAQANSDMHEVHSIIENTIKDLEFMADRCKRGIKLCQEYYPRVQTALDTDDGFQAIQNEIPQILTELYQPKNECLLVQPTFQLFLMHIIQSYHINFEMESIGVFGQFDIKEKGSLAVALRQSDWYSVIGSIVEICLNLLLEARDATKEHL